MTHILTMNFGKIYKIRQRSFRFKSSLFMYFSPFLHFFFTKFIIKMCVNYVAMIRGVK